MRLRRGFIRLALRVQGSDSSDEKGAKDRQRHKLETTCWAGEQGQGRRPPPPSISPLIHYRLYMSKRLPSVDSAERACDAFVRLLSPEDSATLPFLAANSKHCYLE